MRLWSIHPKYLDSKGLLAVWREGLLAQKVLEGKTRGYRNHPQLVRFKKTKDPTATIGSYLLALVQEATKRNYRFDESKILRKSRRSASLSVTRSQLRYESQHLLKKLEHRDPARFLKLKGRVLSPHPLFRAIPGPLEIWERALCE